MPCLGAQGTVGRASRERRGASEPGRARICYPDGAVDPQHETPAQAVRRRARRTLRTLRHRLGVGAIVLAILAAWTLAVGPDVAAEGAEGAAQQVAVESAQTLAAKAGVIAGKVGTLLAAVSGKLAAVAGAVGAAALGALARRRRRGR